MNHSITRLVYFWIGLVAFVASARCETIQFEVDTTAPTKPISPYIYGVNQFHGVLDGFSGDFAGAKFVRLGGNRLTAYNWTNNASNAGTDYKCVSDNYLVSGPVLSAFALSPGGANIPIIAFAAKHQAAALLTIPMNGLVAADMDGSDVRLSGADYRKRRFAAEMPAKNAPFTMKPDPHSRIVYEDEFVNWVKQTYPYSVTDPSRPIWFSLDNEPDLWSGTHPEVHPLPVTYAELAEKSIAYAAAAKAVMPNALIFGAVSYGWEGFVRLQGASDANDRDFLEYFLQQMRAAELARHIRLVDVLDVHWYPEATGNGRRIVFEKPSLDPAVLKARMQAPRSLWDPVYSEQSWIVDRQLHEPIRLIPRLMEKIAKCYPGTKLSFSEYEYGGGADISGGIAEADALGIFGREGVFAAALWPEREMPFVGAGFAMYRNFDGKGGCFGDESVPAKTSNIADSSIYASLDSAHPRRMVLVLINKTAGVLPAEVKIRAGDGTIEAVRAFQLTARGARPAPAATVPVVDGSSIRYAMPAFSVTSMEVRQK